jgi:hypothetical protein
MQRVDAPSGAVQLLDGDEHGHTKAVVRAFVAIALVLSVAVWWGNTHERAVEAGKHPGERPHLAVADQVLGGWLWYDSVWYHDIAGHMYGDGQQARFAKGRQSAAPFFPAYPLVVVTVGLVTRDLALAEIVSTFVLGLCAALLFAAWCRRRMSRRAALAATGMLLVYPYAWFLYGSGYADALLLAATIGSFVLLERDRVFLAGLAGIVATAARPTGVIVVVGLFAVALERRGTVSHDPTASLVRGWRLHPERFAKRDAAVLLALCGVGAYALFQWAVFHDPLAFIHAERAWQQPQGWRTWLKLQLFKDYQHAPRAWFYRLVAQGALAVLFVGASRSVARRFGWGYGVFALLMAAVPAFSTSDFMGTGRYLLACFPVFALGGAWLAEHVRRPAIALVPSAVALVWLTTLYARGYYLS